MQKEMILFIFAVTPFAGVWIEIQAHVINGRFGKVTPFAGVWIEIAERERLKAIDESHSLCGSVD